MGYCVQTDVQRAAGGSDRLRELSDIEVSGAIDATNVQRVIDQASAWVDSFLQRRHVVPLATPYPGEIVELVANEAVYRLKRDRRILSDDDRTEHEERERALTNMSKGIQSVGVDPLPPKSTSVKATVQDRDDDTGLDVRRETLKGFW